MDLTKILEMLRLPADADESAITAKLTSLLNFRTKLAESLKLDATAEDAAIETALGSFLESATANATAATDLASIRLELEELRPKYEELYKKEEELRKKSAELEIDEILKTYGDRIKPESQQTFRDLLLSNRESGIAVLNGLADAPAKPTEPAKSEPPNPKSDEDESGELTPEKKSAEADKLIAEIRKEKPSFDDYEIARDEARRRKPELFS